MTQINREVWTIRSTVGRKKTHRPRCDLSYCRRWVEALAARHRARLGLFDPPGFLREPGEAPRLEVKVAHQFREGGRGTWRVREPHVCSAVVDDLRKMEAELPIREAGLVLIVFNEGPDIPNKDLELFEDALLKERAGRFPAGPQRVPILGPYRPPPLHRGGLADAAAETLSNSER